MRFRAVVSFVFILLLLGPRLGAQEIDIGGIDAVLPEPRQEAAPDPDTAMPAPEAPAPDESAAPEKGGSTGTFWIILTAGGWIGYIIILLSFVSVALMIEHTLTIRQSVLAPPDLAEEILKLLSQGQLAAAIQKAQADPSALGQVLSAGMSQYEFGWAAIEKAAEEATAEQASRLYRKVDYLNVIGNISPMLGLLGTVVGMVFAFQQLAESEGYARASDLAEGIYLALVTTVEGLVVAIPSLAAFSFFSNRIAHLIGETTFLAEQVLLPIKKSFVKKKPG